MIPWLILSFLTLVLICLLVGGVLVSVPSEEEIDFWKEQEADFKSSGFLVDADGNPK